jgi:hypothetical protein
MLKILICLLVLVFSGDLVTGAAGSSRYLGSGASGSRSGYTDKGNAYHRPDGSHLRGGHHRNHKYNGHGQYHGHRSYYGHHRYYGHRGYHGHGSSYRIWIGPGWVPGWWGSAYSYGRYYSYYPAPVVIPEQVQAPEPSQEHESYWYYCQDPQGFYPYVKSCPGGWMKVVPEVVPPESQ